MRVPGLPGDFIWWGARMAKVVAGLAANLVNPSNGTITAQYWLDPFNFIVRYGYVSYNYKYTGQFTAGSYDPVTNTFAPPYGGTVDTIEFGNSGRTWWKATGLDADFGKYLIALRAEDYRAIADLLFDGNDSFVGSAWGDKFYGSDGNDMLKGFGGNDYLEGGDGADTLSGGGGKDRLDGGAGNDTLSGGNRNDTLDGGAGNDILVGGNSNDTLNGGIGRDRLIGGWGPDALDGGGGKDVLTGDGGDDYIFGGMGDDIMTGGAGADTFRFLRTGGHDVITDFNDAEDILDLTWYALGSVSAAKAMAEWVDGDTVFDFGNGDMLVLEDFKKHWLDDDDFLL